MNSIHIISQDVFDKIRSRFSNLEMGDEKGAVTSDPKAARFFDFDFVIEGDTVGRVSISLNETGSLKIFYSQNILEDQESFIKQLWYNFLREMRMFAKRRLLRFDTRDITKSHLNKNDFQYLASTGQKETEMNESKMFGSSKSSYLPLEKTKLIVRHKNPVDETQIGGRSRRHNIKALYIENQDGERFKYPFEHLAGAKAMQRHVANGGRPYDDAGKAIIEMSQHIAELAAFKRHVGLHDSMNREVNEITHRADQKLLNLKKTMENLCRQGFYEQWKESIQPFNDEQMVLDQATMEDYKSKFTVKSFKEDLTQFFPLIHRIMQETGTIELETYVDQEEISVEEDSQKVNDFESFIEWADRVEEGRIEPDTLMQLKELVESGLTLGVDGTSAIEALQGIGIHDDILEGALSELAKVNPEADPVPTIKSWLMKEDPEAAQDLGMSENQEEGAEPQQINLRQIAEMVKQFYDRETGKFPKGETGVVLHVKKELGEEAAALAEKLVNQLTAEADQRMLQQGYGSSDDPMSLGSRVPQDTAFRNKERNVGLEKERNNYQVTINGKNWKVFADQRQAMNIARSLKMKGKDVSVFPTGAPPTESMHGMSEQPDEGNAFGMQARYADKGDKFKVGDQEYIKSEDDEALEAMSRHAKGWEKYGPGMKELAKAGKEGASEKEMDRIRQKHDRYDEEVDLIRKLAGMAK